MLTYGYDSRKTSFRMFSDITDSLVGRGDGEWVPAKQDRQVAHGQADQQVIVCFTPQFLVPEDDREHRDVAQDGEEG